MGSYYRLLECVLVLLASLDKLQLVAGQTATPDDRNSLPLCSYMDKEEIQRFADQYPDVTCKQDTPGQRMYFNLSYTTGESSSTYTVTLTPENLGDGKIRGIAIQAFATYDSLIGAAFRSSFTGYWRTVDSEANPLVNNESCSNTIAETVTENRANYAYKWQPVNDQLKDVDFRATARVKYDTSEVYYFNITIGQDLPRTSSNTPEIPLFIIIISACVLLTFLLACSLCLLARSSYRKWKRDRELPLRHRDSEPSGTELEEGLPNPGVDNPDEKHPGVYQTKKNWEAIPEPTPPRHKRAQRVSDTVENQIVTDGGDLGHKRGTLEIPRSRVLMQELIGEGAFGDVYKADAIGITNLPMTTVAVKILKDKSAVAGEDFKKELKILMGFQPHPNVIRLLGTCTEKEPYFLVLEFAPLGDLRAFLHQERSKTKTKKPNPKQLLGFAVQIAKGMEYMVAKNCVHRDLATRNVLLGEGLVCKLSDFGLARQVDNRRTYEMKTNTRVPVRWMAPESIEDNIYSVKSDVWSFGILCWELVTMGSHPYGGFNASEVIKKVIKGQRLEKPAHCSTEMYVIMTSCWQEKPKRRPEFTNLRQQLETMFANAEDVIDAKTFDSKGYVYLTPARWQNSEEDAPKRRKKPRQHIQNEYEFNAQVKN